MTQDERKGLILCLKIEFSDGLWGGVKSKQEFDRLREKYKIHISESELRMWKTDNTLGNVR